METAKIFENGKSQVVRLPKESLWQTFMEGLDSFTDDIFEDGRDQGVQKEREIL